MLACCSAAVLSSSVGEMKMQTRQTRWLDQHWQVATASFITASLPSALHQAVRCSVPGEKSGRGRLTSPVMAMASRLSLSTPSSPPSRSAGTNISTTATPISSSISSTAASPSAAAARSPRVPDCGCTRCTGPRGEGQQQCHPAVSSKRKLMRLSDLIHYGYIQPSAWSPYVIDPDGKEQHGCLAERSDRRRNLYLIRLEPDDWVSVSDFVSRVHGKVVTDGYDKLMMRTTRPSGEQVDITLDRLRHAIAEELDWCTCERDESRWPRVQSPSQRRAGIGVVAGLPADRWRSQSSGGAAVGAGAARSRKRPLPDGGCVGATDIGSDADNQRGSWADSEAEDSAVELESIQSSDEGSDGDTDEQKQEHSSQGRMQVDSVAEFVAELDPDADRTESDSAAHSDGQADANASVGDGDGADKDDDDDDDDDDDGHKECWPSDGHQSVDPAVISQSTRFDVAERRRSSRREHRGDDPAFPSPAAPSSYSQEMHRRSAAAKGQSDARLDQAPPPQPVDDLQVTVYDHRDREVAACSLPWVFMPSKGRADRAHINLRALGLEPDRTICIVIERGDYEAYRRHVGRQHVLAVMEQCSRGIGYARLIIQCLASRLAGSAGWEMYWSIDDNILAFHTAVASAGSDHHHQLQVVDMSAVMREAEAVMRFADEAETVPRQHSIAMVGFESERGQGPATRPYASNRFVAACVLINIRATAQVAYRPSNRTKKEDVGFFHRLMRLNQSGHSCCTLKLRKYRWRVVLYQSGGIIQAKQERASARADRKHRDSSSKSWSARSGRSSSSSSSSPAPSSSKHSSSSPLDALRAVHRRLQQSRALLVAPGCCSPLTAWSLERAVDVVAKYEQRQRQREAEERSRRPNAIVTRPLVELVLEQHRRIDWPQILSALLPQTSDAVDRVAARKRWRVVWDSWKSQPDVRQHPERASLDALLSQVDFGLIDSAEHILHLRAGTQSWDAVKRAVELQRAEESPSDSDELHLVTPRARAGGKLSQKYRSRLKSTAR